MAQRHYEKRINRSQKRALGALNLFNIAAEQLETEARNQREVYDLLEAERQIAADKYLAACMTLQEAHEVQDAVLHDLQEQAKEHGVRASKQAETLRGLFI